MIRSLQIINAGLHNGDSKLNSYDVELTEAIRFLYGKLQSDSTNIYYHKLIANLSKLRIKYLPIGYVERYCLSQISEHILSKYSVNVAEAFILSYIILNKFTTLTTMYHKLCSSGLLSPTLINGVRIEDIEAIAQFIVVSLSNTKLIKITDNNYLMPGSLLCINF